MIAHNMDVIERRNALSQSLTENNNDARQGYDIKLVSECQGFVKLHAGHMKHTFSTLNRSAVSK